MLAKSPIRITIGTKISFLIAALLVLSVVFLVWISTRLFVEDNTALIQQLNAETAASHARQTREVIGRLSEKLFFIGHAALVDEGRSRSRLIEDVFSRDETLLGVFVYERGEKPAVRAARVSPAVALAGDADGKRLIAALANAADLSLDAALKGEPQVARLALHDGAPAVALALPFIKADAAQDFSHAVVGVTLQSRFMKVVAEKELITTFLVDRKGNCLAHADAALAEAGENLAYLDIVRELLQGKYHNGQTRYVDSQSGEARLGAYRTVGFAGLGIVAEVPEAKASEAAQWMIYRAGLVAAIVLFASVLIGHLFSDTITSPIYELVSAATRIAKGDFQIDLKPRTRDEVAYLASAFNSMAKGLKERVKLKTIFQKFHSKEITDKLLAGEVKLGGEKRRAVVFFSDIRGFTRMSESMAPDAVVELLNEYLSRMVPIITENGGVVDKFIGDAIMAMWGVPIEKKDDAVNAVWACLMMREELEELNKERRKRGAPELLIGMGLHMGEVTAGNIGSSERMEYTVIGDTVNLASRIESSTKVYGVDLLVEKSIYEKTKQTFVMEACAPIQVKGKTAPIELYRVRGYYDEKKQPVLVETPFSTYPPEGDEKAAA